MNIRVGQLELNQFCRGDARTLYCIRNHPSVRQFMTNPELIPYSSHLEWVNSSLLGNPNHLLFLVRSPSFNRAVGLAQLKIGAESVEIGVMFRQPAKHQIAIAISTAAMLHMAFERLKMICLTSYILPSHDIALRFNQGFGAWEEKSDRPGMVKLKLDAHRCLTNDKYQRLMRRMRRQGLVITDT